MSINNRPASALMVLIALTLATGPVAAQIATGPEVGETIPDFRVQDQQGVWRTLENLSGPEGLLLLFYRTADW